MTVEKLFSSHNPLNNIPGTKNYINYDSDNDASYQALRNYNNGFNYSPYTDYLKFLVVPYWVNERLAQIGYDYMKVVDYANALKYLTEEERIALLSMSLIPINKEGDDLINIDPRDIPLLTDWNNSKGDNVGIDNLHYYNNLIRQYKGIIIQRLSREKAYVQTENDNYYDTSRIIDNLPYKFTNTSEYIAIVIQDDFYIFISNKENKLQFFQDLLKEIYTKIPLSLLVKDHRYNSIFSQYLNLLS